VEELEGLLQEQEELDDITLRCELEALSTRETCLDHHEADLERSRKTWRMPVPRSWPVSSTRMPERPG
jgi:hypothetical protein